MAQSIAAGSSSEPTGSGGVISLAASDGHVLGAYEARAAGRARGGLVVAQDAFGVGDYIRSVCDSYAAEGYDCIAPFLYDRQSRDAVFDHSEAGMAGSRRLRRGLDWNGVVADVAACADRLRASGKVGIIGYCVGGSIAWLAASAVPLAAACSYYGSDIAAWLDKVPHCPVMLHFGERDHLIPMTDVAKVRAAYPDIPTFVYAAGHGFDGTSDRHDPAAATLARERTRAFLRQHIG